jgi:hypothetical protein
MKVMNCESRRDAVMKGTIAAAPVLMPINKNNVSWFDGLRK